MLVQKKKVSGSAKDRKGFWAGWIGCHPHTQTTFAFWRCKILELLSANNANRLLHGMCGRYPILASQLTCRWCLWSIRVQALWNAAPLCSAYLCGFSVHSDVSQHVSQWNVEPSPLWCCWLLLGNTAEFSESVKTKIGHWDCVEDICTYRSPWDVYICISRESHRVVNVLGSFIILVVLLENCSRCR